MIKQLRLFLLLTLLLGLTLGCGLIGGKKETPPPPPATEAPSGGEEAPAPTALPTEEEEVSESPGDRTETGEEDEEIGLSSITGGLQGLDSYRSHFEMTFEDTTGDETEYWTFEMDTEYVRDPFAQRVVIRGGEAGEGLESVQIGDRQYVVFGDGQCISSSADEAEELDTELFEPDDFIGGLEKARRVRPDEEVNGILCRHYTFDETYVNWGDITSAEGEMWVAVDGDYVVKHILQAEGKNPATGEEGHLEWVYEVRDVNKSFSIEPPAGCEAAESELPTMPDATDMTSMGGMVMYTSASSFDDVLAFYREQMAAEGWSEQDDSFIGDGTAILNYAKDGRTATVTLASDDGAVSVVIMSE